MQRREKRRRTRPLRGRWVWIPRDELRALLEAARVMAEDGQVAAGPPANLAGPAAPGVAR
jgi:hypothetical protein